MKSGSHDSAPNDDATANGRTPWSQLILLQLDHQSVIVVFLLVGLISLTSLWVWRDWIQGSVIEIDEAAPLPYRFTIDLNEASAAELAQLPEIGETMADRIIEARKRNGGFRSVDELRNVRGIGAKTFEQIRPYLRPLSDYEG
jgi:competence protein ComEA